MYDSRKSGCKIWSKRIGRVSGAETETRIFRFTMATTAREITGSGATLGNIPTARSGLSVTPATRKQSQHGQRFIMRLRKFIRSTIGSYEDFCTRCKR